MKAKMPVGNRALISRAGLACPRNRLPAPSTQPCGQKWIALRRDTHIVFAWPSGGSAIKRTGEANRRLGVVVSPAHCFAVRQPLARWP